MVHIVWSNLVFFGPRAATFSVIGTLRDAMKFSLHAEQRGDRI